MFFISSILLQRYENATNETIFLHYFSFECFVRIKKLPQKNGEV